MHDPSQPQTPTAPAVTPSVADRPVLLCDATPQAMIQELYRRGKSAVLSYANLTAAGPGSTANLGDTRIRCVVTDDVDQSELGNFFRRLAALADKQRVARVAVQVDDADDLFELKGDRLGMSLDDFCRKYQQPATNGRRRLPWLNTDTPGKRVPELLAPAWYAEAGIVCARTSVPGVDEPVTIAGVDTDAVIYQFVDGRLFQIMALFGTEAFHVIHQALVRKYGECISQNEAPRQLLWWTLSASIELTFGRLVPREPARLRIWHDTMLREAESREPSRHTDI